MVHKRVKVGPWGGASLYKHLLSTTLGSQFDLHIINQRENLILDQEVLKAILTITTSIN